MNGVWDILDFAWGNPSTHGGDGGDGEGAVPATLALEDGDVESNHGDEAAGSDDEVTTTQPEQSEDVEESPSMPLGTLDTSHDGWDLRADFEAAQSGWIPDDAHVVDDSQPMEITKEPNDSQPNVEVPDTQPDIEVPDIEVPCTQPDIEDKPDAKLNDEAVSGTAVAPLEPSNKALEMPPPRLPPPDHLKRKREVYARMQQLRLGLGV